VKYALIRRNQRAWPIRVQCRMLGVRVAGYHEHVVRRLPIVRRRHLSAQALVVHIRAVFWQIAELMAGPASGANCMLRAFVWGNCGGKD
jgi:hypothetical protein